MCIIHKCILFISKHGSDKELFLKVFIVDMMGIQICVVIVHITFTGVNMVSLRESLSLLFTADAIQSYQETINHVVKKFTDKINTQ